MSQRLRRWLRRHDSLFTRLILLHAALAMGLSAVYFTLYFLNRNITVATLLAEHWAEPLSKTAEVPLQSTPRLRDDLAVQVRDAPPPLAVMTPWLAPRVDALKRGLAEHGVHVLRVAMDNNTQPTTVWMEVDRPGRHAIWLGMRGPLMSPHEILRLILGCVLVTLLVLGLAWLPSRRMSHRLATLRTQMLEGQPVQPSDVDFTTTPEVADIERAYNDLLNLLARQHSERNLLLAGVSHDLRSPLSRIRMACELLPDHRDIEPRKKSISANVMAADRLIESFMDLVRSAELPLNQRVDIAQLVCHVAAMFDDADQAIRVQAPPSLYLDGTHGHLLERALFNLIDNAFKHGKPPVLVRVRDETSHIVLEVQDAGLGVQEAEREWVMQAFSRGDASRTKVGSGLGLAIVRQLVERMQGQVLMHGEAGAWVLGLRLPKHRAAPTTPAKQP